MSRLETYKAVTQGLTQPDSIFRDAVSSYGDIKTDFYSMKRNTINRLNQRGVGAQINDDQPVEVVGMVNFREKQLTLNELSGVKTYNLDDFDPRYLRVLYQNVRGSERNPDELPLSKFALELIDAQVEYEEPFPERKLSGNIENSQELFSSRRQLEQAFANEIVLLVELDEFIKDNGLDTVFESHKDELIHLVDKKAFDQSFNDALKDLNETAVQVLGA